MHHIRHHTKSLANTRLILLTMRFTILLPLFVLSATSMELIHGKRDTCPSTSDCVTLDHCKNLVSFFLTLL